MRPPTIAMAATASSVRLSLQSVLRREHLLAVAVLGAIIALSWVYLLAGEASMSDTNGWLMPMHSGPWSLRYGLLMLLMWIVMMMAMMLPSATPAILLFATIARSARQRQSPMAHWGMFATGYLLIWFGFSILAVALQFALDEAAALSPMLHTTNQTLAGLSLIGAGVYQCSPLKQACIRHCRSPLEFMLTRWRNGASGAVVMGLQHGVVCLGCCWALMLLLFVGGVMNLLWVAGLTTLVLIEKYAPHPDWVRRVVAVALIGWGAATLLAAV